MLEESCHCLTAGYQYKQVGSVGKGESLLPIICVKLLCYWADFRWVPLGSYHCCAGAAPGVPPRQQHASITVLLDSMGLDCTPMSLGETHSDAA